MEVPSRQQSAAQNKGISSPEASEDPPPYSSSGAASSSDTTTAPSSMPGKVGIPRLDFSAYRAASSDVSKDQSTITVSSPTLQNADALTTFLRKQAALPPRPEILIKGKNVHRMDFDLRINMMSYFLPPDDGPPMHYITSVSANPAGQSGRQDNALATIAGAYSTERAKKRLMLTRKTTNWDVEYLGGRLRHLIADLKYRGDVSIEFTTAHQCVIVKPPSGSGLGAVWSGVADAFTETKKFEMEVAWPYANVQREVEGRLCNLANEDQWWNDKAIAYAIVHRQKGFVGVDTWIEAEMDLQLKTTPKEEWGRPSY